MSFVAIAVTTSVVGGVVSYAGQRSAANAAEEAAEHNAQIAGDQARVKELEQHENAKRQRNEKRKALAQARAQLAANGTALGEGSNLDFMLALDDRLETQVLDNARSAQIEVSNLNQSANLARYQGQQQASALRLQSFGTLLDGASTLGGNLYKLNRNTKP